MPSMKRVNGCTAGILQFHQGALYGDPAKMHCRVGMMMATPSTSSRMHLGGLGGDVQGDFEGVYA